MTQENAIQLEALSVSMGLLESLYRAKKETGEQFAEAVEAVSAKAGLEPAVIRAYVAARCSDKVQKAKRAADQLSFVFETLHGQ